MKMEVPYNFDPAILEELKKPRYKDIIDMIFTCPFSEDHHGAKKHYRIFGSHLDAVSNQPKTWEEYVWHIKQIQETGHECCLLVQDLHKPIQPETIQKYLDLGIKVFTVTRWDAAKMIRRLCPEARIVGSITRKVSFAEFKNDVNVSAFDEHVLYFPFNRGLDRMRELNNKHKYVMLVNCGCAWTCPGHYHWYAGKGADGQESRRDKNPCKSGFSSLEISYRTDRLPVIAPYIAKIKLQGREYSTPYLIHDLKEYSNFILNYDNSSKDKLFEKFSSNNAKDSTYLSEDIVTEKYPSFEIEDGWAEWNFSTEL